MGVSWPVFASMRKTTMLSDFWLAANRRVPVGSISKLRGILPLRVRNSDLCQRPLTLVDREDGDAVVAAVGGVQKVARGMDLDFGVVVAAGEVLGRVEMVCRGCKFPLAGSFENTVTV